MISELWAFVLVLGLANSAYMVPRERHGTGHVPHLNLNPDFTGCCWAADHLSTSVFLICVMGRLPHRAGAALTPLTHCVRDASLCAGAPLVMPLAQAAV